MHVPSSGLVSVTNPLSLASQQKHKIKATDAFNRNDKPLHIDTGVLQTVGINMEVSKARASPEGGLIPGSNDLQKMRRSTS